MFFVVCTSAIGLDPLQVMWCSWPRGMWIKGACRMLNVLVLTAEKGGIVHCQQIRCFCFESIELSFMLMSDSLIRTNVSCMVTANRMPAISCLMLFATGAIFDTAFNMHRWEFSSWICNIFDSVGAWKRISQVQPTRIPKSSLNGRLAHRRALEWSSQIATRDTSLFMKRVYNI